MDTPVRINITPGADTSFSVTWPVDYDFTGFHVEVFEADRQLRNTVSFTAADNVVQGKILWDDRFPRKDTMRFHLRLRPTETTGDRLSVAFEAYVTA